VVVCCTTERTEGAIPTPDDPESWRSRAEARAIGEVFRDPEAQRIMVDIAEGYERLADRAAERRAQRQGLS
jgi:hypothetical protein